jgi:hypothetical protein
MAEELKGQGGATSELEALRERVGKLEGEKVVTAPPRMVPLGAGFTDQFGRPVMVEARNESFGERLVRNEFADIDRDEFLSDPTVQAIGREVAGDEALRRPIPEPSPIPQRVPIDTRTGLPSTGPALTPAETKNRALVDRAADYQARLDRAEAEERHRKAFGDDE